MPERDFLTRSWTVLSTRRKPRKIRIPEVNTYSTQIRECNSLHSRLGLPLRADVETRSSHFPDISTFPSLTSSPHYSRSAPPIAVRGFAGSPGGHPAQLAWQHDTSSPEVKMDTGHVTLHSQSSVFTSNTDAHFDEDQEQKRKRQMTPTQLTEHLRLHGYGEPRVLTTTSLSHQKFNGKSRSLPKNPSKREIIKGRARLDYEMANMRALAFCEQQTSKVFRSASANMRNRDVQFVEDEMREKMHKEDVDTHDQTEGVVVMAIDREELFKRVNTWIEEVECALNDVT
ncbi:uncharacterized protein LOC110445673 [Mizuhopecten yessoensis]|uniref:Uncharacterized protein n=1 Tax=Mizuhopecten yessoensis TaxID=6573 RepID=A0A210R6N9_MIZYE|nr:uncharacterized protein LOC110445673 [Mizuhopecten yessoensis]XP_021346096.1 uncharacterized protein LOC110445673 [Mizuhopecten yessoensis]XP_021346105.1 uncharacterized protein LOC110445673 [Mizuhopecten yessoensis]XP_021346114.1 uncharacterized protein LOC110445673 [Mizuhopecten yessoensis]OWF56604.1 hypothetical protein KP79_PYT16964 [Mizuhopecten yessoensis]